MRETGLTRSQHALRETIRSTGFRFFVQVVNRKAFDGDESAGRHRLPRRRIISCKKPAESGLPNFWSGRRDLNPRLRPWQGRTLPLSYSRSSLHSTALPPDRQFYCTRNEHPLSLDCEPSTIPNSAMYCSCALRALAWM